MDEYGVRIEDRVVQVPLEKLKRHPLNPKRENEDREVSRVFLAEIKKEGVKDPDPYYISPRPRERRTQETATTHRR